MDYKSKIQELRDSLEPLYSKKAKLTNEIDEVWDAIHILERDAVTDINLLLNLSWRLYEHAHMYLDTKGAILVAVSFSTDADPDPTILAPGIDMVVSDAVPAIRGTFDAVRDWAHANNLNIDWSEFESTESYCTNKLAELESLRNRWNKEN